MWTSNKDAEQRAATFLSSAGPGGEVAGRQLALIAMAEFADQDAVAFQTLLP
jgi:hypothetical protein